MDNELDRIRNTLDSMSQALNLIQRDDGRLANGSVGLDQLSPDVSTGILPAEGWVTGTKYLVNQPVFYRDDATDDIGLYSCVIEHTSTNFGDDLLLGNWALLVDYTPPQVAGIVQVSDGGTGATNAAAARANLGLGQVATQSIIPVAMGGTGANNAAAARVALGLAIGSQIQAHSEELDTLALLESTSYGRGFNELDDAAAALVKIGLPNVDDTSDEDKPLSNAQIAAISMRPLFSEEVTTAVASVPLTLDLANYRHFWLFWSNIVPAVDSANFRLRTSQDGVVFDEGASDYQTALSGNATAVLDYIDLDLLTRVGAASGEPGCSGNILIQNPGAAAKTMMNGTNTFVSDSNGLGNRSISALRDDESIVQAIELSFHNGNIAAGGFVELYGVRA